MMLYNHRPHHESINNLTPADVYFGRGQTILAERERIKRQTIATAACSISCRPPDIAKPMGQTLPHFTKPVVPITLTTDKLDTR
jgi:hypothetical protein